jgi:hypothetical protein
VFRRPERIKEDQLPPGLAAPFFTTVLIALATCSGCGPHAGGGAGGQMGGGGSPGGGGAGGAIDAPADLPGSGGSSGSGDATTMTDATSERTGDTTTMTDATSEPTEVGGNDICAGHAFEGGPIPNVTSDAFCAKYGAICKFGGAGGYASRADCLAQYGGAVPVIQGCRASGLCDAAFVYLQPGVTVEFLQAYCTRALTFAACN